MDISQTIEADSSQLNADDLIAGPRTVTVTGVRGGTADQPVNIDLAEYPDKAFRPGKSMRRVLVAAWGPEASGYVGRRLTLFNDPTVKWGGQAVGGVRIKAMSHIDKTLSLALTETRGKRAKFTVEPLVEQPPASKILLDEAKIAASTVEQCAQARTYLAKYQAAEPDRVAALLTLVEQREAKLAEEQTA